MIAPGIYTPMRWRDGGDTTQHTNLPRSIKVKKGRGQRKNKRDAAGRQLHHTTVQFDQRRAYHEQVASLGHR